MILTGAGQGITQQATSLLNSLKDKWKRPDVQVLVVTPKVEATAKDLLLYYRQRVKEAGFVLATKGMAPSSGFVTVYALLQTAGGARPPTSLDENSRRFSQHLTHTQNISFARRKRRSTEYRYTRVLYAVKKRIGGERLLKQTI